MGKQVQIGNSILTIPIVGETQDWAEELTEVLCAIVAALQGVTGTNDISPTTANIENNLSAGTTIPLFTFNTSSVYSFDANYYVRRVYDADGDTVDDTTISESGRLLAEFDKLK